MSDASHSFAIANLLLSLFGIGLAIVLLRHPERLVGRGAAPVQFPRTVRGFAFAGLAAAVGGLVVLLVQFLPE